MAESGNFSSELAADRVDDTMNRELYITPEVAIGSISVPSATLGASIHKTDTERMSWESGDPEPIDPDDNGKK